ncbi:MAG: hemerythrin domain-containing protein [Segetibacter sp.]
MEADHEAAGQILYELNGLTNQYTPPASACNSFKLLYHKLKALEEDLHQHIHLENNILFPKVALLEKELKELI